MKLRETKLEVSRCSDDNVSLNKHVAAGGHAYMEADTGRIHHEEIVSSRIFSFLYQHRTGRRLRDIIMRSRWLHACVRRFANSTLSKPLIDKLIVTTNINIDEVELPLQQYPCFNAFFSRRLKPSVRPCDSSRKTMISPADGKLITLAIVDTEQSVLVKGIAIRICDLLQKEKAELQGLCGGNITVIRLYLADYHRFHFPVSGTVVENYRVPGNFYSVSPFPGNDLGFYTANVRQVTRIVSPEFGSLWLVAIGGFLISSIQQTFATNEVTKGLEMGYFEFGGSTLVLLTEANVALYQPLFIENSSNGVETQIKWGSVIAKKKADVANQ